MPITVGIVDDGATEDDVDAVAAYFAAVDQRFSTYRPESEVSRLNAGLDPARISDECARYCSYARRPASSATAISTSPATMESTHPGW